MATRFTIDEGTVERLGCATLAVLAAGMSLAALGWPFLMRGRKDAALACLTWGVGWGGALAVVLAVATLALGALVKLRALLRARPSR